MDFYAEFRKLVENLPHNALSSKTAENCVFGDYIFRSKNTYLSYFINESQDCYYAEHLVNCRDCVDCMHLTSSELCYECIDGSQLYNCSFLQDCHNCSACDFAIDCINCKNCFGSFGLRNQSFCIFNKNYPEETYYEKVAQLKKNPPQKILEVLLPEFDKHPRLFARLLKGGENCFGDYIYFSKNCYSCFNVRNVENCFYVSEMMHPEVISRDCVDCDFVSESELCYECHNIHACSNSNFLDNCSGCSDSDYLLFCYNCRNCFGCMYLNNKEYCILNRQFSRNEYLFALGQIKEALKKAGIYGRPLAQILK